MSFKRFNLSNQMLTSLNRQGYELPSPIQEKVIPKALKGANIVAQSETGSGKTHSFLIPMLEQIDFNNQNVQALIISPTRELARQTFSFLNAFNIEFPLLKTKLFISGIEKDKTFRKGSLVPHIIVATPNRLQTILVGEDLISLQDVKMFILDEADMLMEFGYFKEIDSIFQLFKKALQVMVFSATFEAHLKVHLEKYVGANFSIEVSEQKTAALVKHYALDIKHQDPFKMILTFIKQYRPYLLIIFANLKEEVDNISRYLSENNLKHIKIHGDLKARQRKASYKKILSDEYPIIVASDLAARGLDIDNISEVLNYNLPNDLTYYFHRAGRTGRFFSEGKCFSFYNVDTLKQIEQLEKQNINFTFLEIKNNEFVIKKVDKEKKIAKQEDTEYIKKIKKVVIETKGKKVRPNYKKKMRHSIKKVTKKYQQNIKKRQKREEKRK